MREITVPALYEVPADANLTSLIRDYAAQTPDAAAFGRQVDGKWHDVTARQFLAEVTAAAKGLIARGVAPGDRVGIMSRTSYEWTLLDFAIWSAGGVPVPVYETSSVEQVAWIASDSGMTAIFVENDGNANTAVSAQHQVSELKGIWQIDAGAIDQLVADGADIPDVEVAARSAALRPETLATIIYTSGTTGRPKGCMLTHANLLSECGNAVAMLTRLFDPKQVAEASTLLFLPLAHVLARVIELATISARVKLGHCADAKDVVVEAANFRPTFLLAVPRVFEKIYNGSRQRAETDGKAKIFDAAAGVAVAYAQAVEQGQPPFGLRLKHAVFDRLVYRKLRAALGGRAEYAISGGAPLGTRLVYFFRGIGLYTLEGYGLTESSAAAALNPVGAARAGTVGPPLPGTSIRIADDGEILMRGSIVFGGYWRNEAATADAFSDGWFHTGDIGALDDDGFLRITGRKKEIIVTAGGKNVPPAVLEDRITAHPLISQCMVVGDQRPYIAALITIDEEALPHWLATHGKPFGASVADLVDDPDLNAEVQSAIDRANQAVSKAESIRKFRILPAEWSVEGGQITPSLKLKRAVVLKAHAGDIDALYGG